MMKKVALVTGGSRGIGLAIARRLGREGYALSVVSLESQEQSQQSLDVLTEQGIPWVYIQANIASHNDRLRIVEETIKAFGRIDVLVNNAGVAPRVRADLLDMSEESFDFVVGINTKGNMFLTQTVAKQMLRQEVRGKKRGTIINISSCSAEVSSINRGE